MRPLIDTFVWGTAALVVFSVITDAAPARPARAPKYEHFMLGVFIDYPKEVLPVPLTKVFTDFLTHGIEIVSIGQHNYYPLATEKRLNTFAKANGVQFICNVFMPEPIDGQYGDDQLRAVIQGQVEAVNALPDSDAVVGWRIGDEIEAMFWGEKDRKQRLAKGEKNFQRYSSLIREMDPKRRVTVNHCYMPGERWQERDEDAFSHSGWMELHEDEAFSSSGRIGLHSGYRVRQEIAEARRHGLDNYLLVAQASSCPRGAVNLRWYGYRHPINDAVLDSRTVAQDIQDCAEVAYAEGAAGILYFLYCGGASDDYERYTLVDLHGDDYLGKWEAVRKAARNIRQWEGAPSCVIVAPTNHSWAVVPLTMTVEAEAPANDPVTVVKADYSLDGALSWNPLPDAVKPPYTFILDADKVKELPSTAWLRVRALNKRGPSLWDVIEVRCSK